MIFNKSSFVLHTIGKVEDKYIPEGKLGEGSFGSVFSSVLKATSQARAVKHIEKKNVKHPDRLKNEISTLMACDHPHIVKLFEVIEDKKNVYLIMEKCSGGELFDYISENSQVPEAEALSLFRQVMLAVRYLHSNRIVHRDLKPENLMFSDKSTLKIIDFGIARMADGAEMTTRAGTVIEK